MKNLQIPETRKIVEETGKNRLTGFHKNLKISTNQKDKFGKVKVNLSLCLTN
jgi:hypothetical protein